MESELEPTLEDEEACKWSVEMTIDERLWRFLLDLCLMGTRKTRLRCDAEPARLARSYSGARAPTEGSVSSVTELMPWGLSEPSPSLGECKPTLFRIRARLLARSFEGVLEALRLRLWSGSREPERERIILPTPPRPVVSNSYG